MVQLQPWRKPPVAYPYEICDNSIPQSGWSVAPQNVWIPQSGDLSYRPAWVPPRPSSDTWKPTFCMVARTYNGHAPQLSPFSIDRFIASMLAQSFSDWYLVILDTDPGRDFPYLYLNLTEWARHEEPDRIKVKASPQGSDNPFANWPEFNSYERLHRRIYWETDRALVQDCPRNSEYFLATNADNWYHPNFFKIVNETIRGRETHLVGVDFFTRHSGWVWGVPHSQRTCRLFQKFNPSMCNGAAAGRSDLGSMIFNASRWRSQAVSFSEVISRCEMTPSNGDGCMARHLRHDFAWMAERIPQTLFSHAPNPWLCVLYGGVLVRGPTESEDEVPSFDCVSPAQAAVELAGHNYIAFPFPNNGTCYQSSKVKYDQDPLGHLPFIYNSTGRFPI